MHKKKILFIDNGFLGYGSSLSMLNLINSIRDSYDITFYSPSNTIKTNLLETNQINYYKDKFITVSHTVKVDSAKKWLMFPIKAVIKIIINILATLRLVKYIKKHNFDIIHSNSASLSCGFFAAKICNKKHVWHLREYLFKNQETYPIMGFTILRYLINKSDYSISITEGIKSFYKAKYTAIYDAVIDEEKLMSYPNNQRENYLLFCGSLGKGKRPEDALKAFKQISPLYPNLRLKIAGIGDRLEYLQKLAKCLQIDSKVDFLGYVNDPYPLFRNAICYLMTSSFEGLGRTTIEAMANKCLVIGYNNAGTAEIIKHNETGFLYNDLNELITYIKYILETNDKDLEIIRSKAIAWALKNCNEKDYGKKVSAIYEELLANKYKK